MTTAGRLAIAGAALGAAVWCCRAAAEPAVAIKEQDGIRAELSVTETDAVFRWRFLKPIDTPLEEVTATINGRPLGVPAVQPYPGSGQTTAVIGLLDISGLERRDAIERLKMALLMLAARKSAHHQVAFAVYALEGRLLLPQGDDPNDTLRLLMQIPALDDIANLSGALLSSLRTLEKIAATRRAIYVFTDGHNGSEIPLARVEEIARKTDTTVTFVLLPGGRPVDMSALTQLAQGTGGKVVNESDIGPFLTEPFALIDSGAQVRFPLEGARRLYWEKQGTVNVSLRYGPGLLELQSDASVPAASLGETVSYVTGRHWAALSMVLAIALAVVGLFVFARRSRKPVIVAVASKSANFGPALVDVDEGTKYPLKGPLTRIGRSADNDIVLQVATVGRFHAVVQQIGDRAYSIVDQSSANGILVNNQKIDTVTLSDGDTITLGAKRLRFSMV
jgi:hypothetical protein